MGPEEMESEAKLNLLEKRFCFSFCGLFLKSLLLVVLLLHDVVSEEEQDSSQLLLLLSNGLILLKTELAVAPKDVGKIDETSKLLLLP